jgi:hypothetical protein
VEEFAMRRNKIWATAAVVGMALLLAIILGGIAWLLSHASESDVGLPVLAIAGAVLMLGTLALVSVSFAIFDLDDKTQALALPEGSIRAVIALMLIVLFAILTIYLYGSMSVSKMTSIGKLTETQEKELVLKFPKEQIIAVIGPSESDKTYTVLFLEGHNPASEDFAKQVLVMLGTLVAAISSFYFGTRAVSEPQSGGPTRAAPRIRAISPPSIAPDGSAFPFEITGDNLDQIAAVKIVSGSSQVEGTDVLSNASTVRCKLSIPSDAAKGAWDIIATESSGRLATLLHGLMLVPPPAVSPG